MDAPPEPSSQTPAESELMARNGIRCVPTNYYYVGGYRYTQLADAVAQASRSAARAEKRSRGRHF